MKTITRQQLEAQSKAYVDACERDLEAAQQRLERARRIQKHLTEGGKAANCPTPILNETVHSANRFAARVDALMMASYCEEDSSVDPSKP